MNSEVNEQISKLETRVVALERLLERVRAKAKADVERLTRHNKRLAKERDELKTQVKELEGQLEGMKIAYNLTRAVHVDPEPEIDRILKRPL